MVRPFVALALALPVAAQAQPSRPFGTEPAWPAGDISSVLIPRAQPGPAQSPVPATPSAAPTVRVRAPYRQVEPPAPVDLDAARRAQGERLRNPDGWRRGALDSEQERRQEPTSRFRQTPVGPAFSVAPPTLDPPR